MNKLTQELYMSFRKMCLEYKLKLLQQYPREPLLIAYYQTYFRYYDDERVWLEGKL